MRTNYKILSQDSCWYYKAVEAFLFYLFFKVPLAFVLCLFFTLLTVINSSGTETMSEKKKENINIPAHLEMIYIDLEKQGEYHITLAFDREGKSLAEFEDILRNDFTGEIEVYLFDQPYTTIYYEDFIGFAAAPVGEGYGPVYIFDVDFLGYLTGRFDFYYTGCFEFYPRIRSKKPYNYSFSIARKELSFGEELRRFFRMIKQKETSELQVKHKPELQAKANITRINVAFEKEGKYGFSLGFPRRLVENKEIDIYTDIDGEVEICLRGEPFSSIKYDNAKWLGDVGGRYLFHGYLYRVGYLTPGFCSVIPKIMSAKDCSFAIGIYRSYSWK